MSYSSDLQQRIAHRQHMKLHKKARVSPPRISEHTKKRQADKSPPVQQKPVRSFKRTVLLEPQGHRIIHQLDQSWSRMSKPMISSVLNIVKGKHG